MDKELKVGQSFEVVEFLGSGNYQKESIGFQGVKESFNIMFSNSETGLTVVSRSEVKPIGKLTITKLKNHG